MNPDRLIWNSVCEKHLHSLGSSLGELCIPLLADCVVAASTEELVFFVFDAVPTFSAPRRRLHDRLLVCVSMSSLSSYFVGLRQGLHGPVHSFDTIAAKCGALFARVF